MVALIVDTSISLQKKHSLHAGQRITPHTPLINTLNAAPAASLPARSSSKTAVCQRPYPSRRVLLLAHRCAQHLYNGAACRIGCRTCSAVLPSAALLLRSATQCAIQTASPTSSPTITAPSPPAALPPANARIRLPGAGTDRPSRAEHEKPIKAALLIGRPAALAAHLW